MTIPRDVKESVGIIPTETDIVQDERGRWYVSKAKPSKTRTSRFRTAHQSVSIIMRTDEIMALTKTYYGKHLNRFLRDY